MAATNALLNYRVDGGWHERDVRAAIINTTGLLVYGSLKAGLQ